MRVIISLLASAAVILAVASIDLLSERLRHRVIGATGTLTGYAGGLERKQTLLNLEQDALF